MPELLRRSICRKLHHFPATLELVKDLMGNLPTNAQAPELAKYEELAHVVIYLWRAAYVIHKHKASQFILDANQERKELVVVPVVMDVPTADDAIVAAW